MRSAPCWRCEMRQAANVVLDHHHNPSLLTERDHETWRLMKIFPRKMANLRAWLHRMPALTARI